MHQLVRPIGAQTDELWQSLVGRPVPLANYRSIAPFSPFRSQTAKKIQKEKPITADWILRGQTHVPR